MNQEYFHPSPREPRRDWEVGDVQFTGDGANVYIMFLKLRDLSAADDTLRISSSEQTGQFKRRQLDRP